MFQLPKSYGITEAFKTPHPGRVMHPTDTRLKDPGGNGDMARDGSGTPITFTFAPVAGVKVVVAYVTLIVVDDGAYLPENFGSSGSPLTNGVLLSGRTNGIDVATITNINNNAELFQCFTGSIGIPGPGAIQGVFDTGDWVAGRYEFHDSPFYLDGDKSDFIRLTVRDDLSVIDFMSSSLRFWTDLTQ